MLLYTFLLLFHQRYPIYPAKANGINIKYRIPLFKPSAGFSPNCCAVFVHKEHWEKAPQLNVTRNKNAKRIDLTKNAFTKNI